MKKKDHHMKCSNDETFALRHSHLSQGNQIMMHPNCWRQTTLTLPPHLHPGSLVSLTEAARLLGVDRRTLQRAVKRGDGPQPEPPDRYVGRPTWFRVMELLLWRSRVVKEGPATVEAVWAWWVASAPLPLVPIAQPRQRPSWWPRGTRRSAAKRRVTTGFSRRVASLESAITLATMTTPLAADAVARLLAK
jgi:hypothetical protein